MMETYFCYLKTAFKLPFLVSDQTIRTLFNHQISQNLYFRACRVMDPTSLSMHPIFTLHRLRLQPFTIPIPGFPDFKLAKFQRPTRTIQYLVPRRLGCPWQCRRVTLINKGILKSF